MHLVCHSKPRVFNESGATERILRAFAVHKGFAESYLNNQLLFLFLETTKQTQ